MKNKLVKLYYAVSMGDDTRFFRQGLDYVPYSEENDTCLLGFYDDFETAFKCAPKVLPGYIRTDKTIFRKDCLVIAHNLEYDTTKVTAQNFKPMKIFKVYELVPQDFYTLNDLMEKLPAGKMVQFLDENCEIENFLKSLDKAQ